MTDERGGRYFREARFFLAGDKVAAQSHIPDARSLMGYMRDMQALGGPPIQVKYATMQDGTQIKAVMMNGQYQAEIVSPKTVSEKKKGCPDFISGMYVPWRSAPHTLLLPSGDTESYVGVEWFVPSAYQLAVTPEMFDQYPDDSEKIALPMYFGPDTPQLVYPLDGSTKTHGDVPETIARIFASMYTGEMRKAIQILLGMGADLTQTIDLSAPTVPIYPFGYDGTMGLVRILGETPAFWLVRFPSSSDTYGILATSFAVCTSTATPEGVEYTPLEGNPFPDDIGEALGKTVFEIFPRAAFDALVEDYAPLYQECGWAFSGSGHEAQTVVTRTRQTGPELFETNAKRILFEFQCTEDEITCHGAIAETGLLHCPEASSAPRIPKYDTGKLVSVVEMSYPVAVAATFGPVHVYYVEDEAQIWRLGTTYFDVETTSTDGLPSQNGTSCPGLYTSSVWSPGREDSWYELNGARVGALWSTGTRNTINMETYVSGPAPYTPPYLLEGVDNRVHKLVRETLWKRTWSETGLATTARSTMFLPFYQRQGVQLLDFSVNQRPGSTATHQYMGVPTSGEAWYRTVDDDGVWVVTAYYDNWALTANNCSLSEEVKTFFEGGVGTTGYSGTVYLLSGITRPDPWQYTDAVISETVYTGKTVYYGASVVTTEAGMTSGRIQNLYTPASGDNAQHAYAYEDAFDATKHIVSRINPSGASDFVTNTEYDLTALPGLRFNFIGLSNTGV